MKRRVGFLHKIGMASLVLVFAALACSIFPSAVKPASTQAGKLPVATKVVLPTLAPKVTPTEMMEVTEEVPTDEPLSESTEVPTVDAPTESWRVAPMDGATLLAYDQTPDLDPEWMSLIDRQARNLAMPKPYYFEIYDLPADSTYLQVRDYYNEQLTQNAMKKAFDDMGDNGVAVATWIGTAVKNRKYLVQYIPADSKYVPWMFILYSNPE
jgi:hypothetical protein